MLLFIHFGELAEMGKHRFNTSHVTLYPEKNAKADTDEKRFNTSHVTLYPNLNPIPENSNLCFNTSHVTLYQRVPCNVMYQPSVSIHLMLLFIAAVDAGKLVLF